MKKQKFSTYFENWLYGKDGYYTKYKAIGKDGDFFTAVSTSIFFGGSIAKKIIDTIKNNKLPKNTTILEVGAHHGYLLADIIQFIYTLNPKLLETLNFAIVERFEHLRNEQKEYLTNSFGDNINISFYDDIDNVKLDSAFIVANEIFDAFACELIYTKDKKLQIAYFDDNIKFEDCKDKDILEKCKKYKIQKGELAIGYEEFAKNICNNIKIFHFLSFDYGEKYPRNDFSCRVYSEHNVYPIFEENLDLKSLFQNSDITYDVNFSHIIDSFQDICICEIEYKTQLKALVGFGILDLLNILKDNTSEEKYLKEVQKVKTLLDPMGMGDRFKMLLIKK